MSISDNELDLRPYLKALGRNWWKIGLAGVLLALVVGAYSFSQPKRYSATALILLPRIRDTLKLSEQYQTVNEPIDSRSRMDALLSIAQSDQLALNVFDELKTESNADLTMDGLRGLVSVTNKGDLIIVAASTLEPELSAKIANLWAKKAVDAINLAYASEKLPEDLARQVEIAHGEYKIAQLELENFIETNPMPLLEKQIDEVTTLMDNLANDRTWLIQYYSYRIQNMQQVVTQAKALRNQLLAGNSDGAAKIGDALAVLQARANSFWTNPTGKIDPRDISTNTVLNLDLTNIEALANANVNYQKELDTLIAEAEKERELAQQKINDMADEIIQAEQMDLLVDAAKQKQVLEVELARQSATRNQLATTRDLAWSAYKALQEIEVQSANKSGTFTQVSLASQAIEPDAPAARGLTEKALIAGVLGVILAALIVIILTGWRSVNSG